MPDPDPKPTPPSTDPDPQPAPATPSTDPLRALLRSVIEVIHRGLHELELGASTDPPPTGGGVGSGGEKPATPTPPTDPVTPQPSPPNDVVDPTDPNHPATPLPTPPDTEPDMPIATKNFAFAHARIESDGEHVRVIKASGFSPAITHTDKDASHCAPGDELPTVTKVRPESGMKQPANVFAYRLTLPANHQIDPKEAVVYATGASADTVQRYRAGGFVETDRTVQVGLEVRHPDVHEEELFKAPKFTVDVLLFRVD